ncbi:PTS sugar transporter subunit IIA [Clostridium chrysemydis]|uniref:PTS sugar transporter subunit IIA n=1 Tax=Clostridium chrysemydis TaxID=2665504 RepID=UPI003F3CA817
MYKILMVSHSALCTGVLEGAKMILGDVRGVECISLTEEGVEKFSDELNKKLLEIKDEKDGILVLADLFGGSPFNRALMESINDPRIKIITGVNLPMLIEAVMNIDSNLEEVYDNILNAGIEGIKTNKITKCDIEDE